MNDAIVPGEDPKLRIFRVVLTYQSCLLSVMLWEWINCIQNEWKFIWRANFSVVSVLYVVLRYLEIIRSIITVYLASVDLSFQECIPWGRWQVFSTMPMTVAVCTLFPLRLAALYEKSKVIYAIFFPLMSAIIVLVGIASQYFGPPVFLEGHGPCFAGAGPDASDIVIVLWIGPFIFDLLAMIFLISRVFIVRRRGAKDSGILHILLRDGLVYFAIISTANLINVGFYLGADPSIQSINSSMAYIVTSMVSCRLILSLRSHAKKEASSAVFVKSGAYAAQSALQRGHDNDLDADLHVLGKHDRSGPSSLAGSAVDEKAAEAGYPPHHRNNGGAGMTHNVAFANFGNVSSRKTDESSLEEGRAAVPGVFVIKESEVRVESDPVQARSRF